MILFYNIIQTSNRGSYNRLNLATQDRIDIWKYMLASMAVIPWWSRVCIYCEFDDAYKHRRDEMVAYVNSLFPNIPIDFFFWRNVYQKEWQKALEPLMEMDSLIWCWCNDDHPFMDYNLECLSEIIELMLKDEPSTCYLSHWPEVLRESTVCTPQLNNLSLKIRKVAVEAIQIVHRDILKKWFWSKNYGDLPLPRTDNLPVNESQPIYVPLRELCRHFDGHMHIDCDANANPPVEIPPGFFENDIKIDYCASEKTEGRVLINPLSKTHFAMDKKGADYHWIKDDLPLFWQNRISEFKTVQEFDEIDLRVGRNESHKRKALMYHKSASTVFQAMLGKPLKNPPQEWIERGYRHAKETN